jgi:hypothetical protein
MRLVFGDTRLFGYLSRILNFTVFLNLGNFGFRWKLDLVLVLFGFGLLFFLNFGSKAYHDFLYKDVKKVLPSLDIFGEGILFFDKWYDSGDNMMPVAGYSILTGIGKAIFEDFV